MITCNLVHPTEILNCSGSRLPPKTHQLKMIRIARFVLIAGAFLGTAGLRAQAPGTPQGLSPGDQLRVAVWRNPEMSGDFTVVANGTLNHPLYREVQVTGIPLSAVEDRLRTFLMRYASNPQFVIQPLLRVTVGGEVRAPNILSVPPETTIAQAIALAGGQSTTGRLDRIKLLRDGRESTIDLRRPDSPAATLLVHSGDQIMVPRSTNVFRDFLGPTASIIGATAAIVNIFLRF